MNKPCKPHEGAVENNHFVSAFRERIYRVFTICGSEIQEGAIVDRLHLKGAGIEIPALMVGERGRGRERGVLSVQLGKRSQARWRANEPVSLGAAALDYTRAGKVKLLERPRATEDDQCLAVLRTPIGYRGGNAHTGDRLGDLSGGDAEQSPFKTFPGFILEGGVIAQGAAGRMGSGEQLISLIPKNEVFRTAYSGRLYGKPGAHYYRFDGKDLQAATWEERAASDLF